MSPNSHHHHHHNTDNEEPEPNHHNCLRGFGTFLYYLGALPLRFVILLWTCCYATCGCIGSICSCFSKYCCAHKKAQADDSVAVPRSPFIIEETKMKMVGYDEAGKPLYQPTHAGDKPIQIYQAPHHIEQP